MFYHHNYDDNGEYRFYFILNKLQYRNVSIVICQDENIGHSYENDEDHEKTCILAVQALRDRGIRCIIGISFDPLFSQQCFNHGIYPITFISDAIFSKLIKFFDKETISIDFMKGYVSTPSGFRSKFQLNEFRRYCMLHGLDDIQITLLKNKLITQYELQRNRMYPWLDNATQILQYNQLENPRVLYNISEIS